MSSSGIAATNERLQNPSGSYQRHIRSGVVTDKPDDGDGSALLLPAGANRHIIITAPAMQRAGHNRVGAR
jgi:hypothetical protein